MYTFDNHFLDSNVIIGYIINDLNSKYGKYFSLSFNRYGSQNVFNECEDVLNNNKNWILRFIKFIDNQLKNKSSDLKKEIKKIIPKIAKYFYNPKDIMYKKVVDVLSNFSERYENKIKSVINGNIEFKIFRKEISDAFKEARKKLIYVFDNLIILKDGHPRPMVDFFDKYQKLRAMGLHKKDFILIVDAYHTNISKLAFLTYDSHLILLQEDIEEEFCINVLEPIIK